MSVAGTVSIFLHRPVRRSAYDRDRRALADAENQPSQGAAVEAHAAVGDSGSENAADVREAVQCDLARAAFELLEHVGASAEREGEGRAGVSGSQLDHFLDEELAPRRRC